MAQQVEELALKAWHSEFNLLNTHKGGKRKLTRHTHTHTNTPCIHRHTLKKLNK